MKFISLFLVVLALAGCSAFSKKRATAAVTAPPKPKTVKISKEDAQSNCEPIGTVKGTFIGLRPNSQKALEDLKKKALDRGANYVRVDASTEAGTTIQGMAFICPDTPVTNPTK